MSDDRWRPLWARGTDKQPEFDVLKEGVPRYLTQALTEWLNEYVLRDSAGRPSHAILRAIELRVQVPLQWGGSGPGLACQSLLTQCEKNGDLFLSVVDLALDMLGAVEGSHQAINKLDHILKIGGSAWMVAPNRRSLSRRVQPEAVQAARRIIDGGSNAGRYLAEAWSHIYGRNPDPGNGYREAVRAIEAAGCPVIIPENSKPTLGLAISAMRDAPVGKYETVFDGIPEGFRPLNAAQGLMELAWKCQSDRHGTADESAPLHVSQQQAEAVLHAALTLVQWFSSGVVRCVKE